jgi:hypothetical protein
LLSQQALRGLSAHIVILEEAAFIKPECFFQVAVPLLLVAGTVLIGISTPSDEDNYFSELMQLKDHLGRDLFLNIFVGLMCASCQKRGKKCNHLLIMKPDWQPAVCMIKVDAIYENNPDIRDRETRGTTVSGFHRVLKPEAIQSFFERDWFRFGQGVPNVLYSSIDPSGGGTMSDHVLVTIANVNWTPVVRLF